jgi:hypothetical protein
VDEAGLFSPRFINRKHLANIATLLGRDTPEIPLKARALGSLINYTVIHAFFHKHATMIELSCPLELGANCAKAFFSAYNPSYSR